MKGFNWIEEAFDNGLWRNAERQACFCFCSSPQPGFDSTKSQNHPPPPAKASRTSVLHTHIIWFGGHINQNAKLHGDECRFPEVLKNREGLGNKCWRLSSNLKRTDSYVHTLHNANTGNSFYKISWGNAARTWHSVTDFTHYKDKQHGWEFPQVYSAWGGSVRPEQTPRASQQWLALVTMNLLLRSIASASAGGSVSLRVKCWHEFLEIQELLHESWCNAVVLWKELQNVMTKWQIYHFNPTYNT